MKNTLSKRLEFILRYGSLRIYENPEEFSAANKGRTIDFEEHEGGKSIYHYKPFPEYEDLDIWEIFQVNIKGRINDFVWNVFWTVKVGLEDSKQTDGKY